MFGLFLGLRNRSRKGTQQTFKDAANLATEQLQSRHELTRDDLFRAIQQSQMVVEFSVDGMVVSANANYLKRMGYTADEIVGKHHQMFVRSDYASSPEYSRLWDTLRAGEVHTGLLCHRDFSGEDIWLPATYIPVPGPEGRVHTILQLSNDATNEHEGNSERAAVIDAIERGQAVIEFSPEGKILRANQNFLDLMKYREEEIVGRHHRIFVDDNYAESHAYREFWDQLRRGEFHSEKFLRFTKGGRPVWIRANYNPIFDAQGRITKVIKFASDITEQVKRQELSEQIANSVSQSVSEMTATIEEIARSVSRTAVLARNTEATTNKMSEVVKSLDDRRRDIGSVVEVIHKIASQTQLLSLNATIEAARAGDHGRGFAVVASEVKTLAIETAAATAKIEQIISVLQQQIGQVVESTSVIHQSMAEVSSNTNTIAAAVEEQSLTSRLLNDTAAQLST